MPADRMANAFNMLRANDLIWGYMVTNYMLGQGPVPVRPALLERRFDGDAGAGAPLLSARSSTSGTPSPRASSRVARRADHARPTSGAGLPRRDQGGPHRAGGVGLSRRQGDEPGRRALRALRLGAYRRGGQPAGAAASTSSGPTPTCRAPTLEEWLKGAEETAGQLVAGLGRLAEAALGQAGAGARAGGDARGDRGGARLLRAGCASTRPDGRSRQAGAGVRAQQGPRRRRAAPGPSSAAGSSLSRLSFRK